MTAQPAAAQDGTRVYTSTVVSAAHLLVGILCAAAGAAVVLAVGGSVVGAVLLLLVIVSVAGRLSTVRLAASPAAVSFGFGAAVGRPRRIRAGDVVEAHAEVLSWPQVFGVGVRLSRRLTRMTVRPGPTLALTLTDGERIRISTRDPEAVLALLHLRSKNDTGGTDDV